MLFFYILCYLPLLPTPPSDGLDLSRFISRISCVWLGFSWAWSHSFWEKTYSFGKILNDSISKIFSWFLSKSNCAFLFIFIFLTFNYFIYIFLNPVHQRINKSKGNLLFLNNRQESSLWYRAQGYIGIHLFSLYPLRTCIRKWQDPVHYTFLSTILFSFFFGARNWTQGFIHAKLLK